MPAQIGVLMVNIGSPDEPTPRAVRRYLAEFLGDPDVVRMNRVAWWLLLHGLILPLRSRSSARLYESIWTERGSPLIDISKRQRELMARELGDDYRVALAMRYGNPSIARGLDELAGCSRIVLLPMFPQFSRATSGSIEKAVREELARRGAKNELAVVPAWFDDVGYLDALAHRVREQRTRAAFDHVVISFHGLPASSVAEGDPYRDQCVATADALARKLELAASEWTLVFQSRFGRGEWLQPYAAEVVPQLAAKYPRVLLLCPGFAADCLETLEELRVRLAEDFHRAGGRELVIAPCLNDEPAWIAALARLVRQRAAHETARAG